ncbi:MAG: hypothetical protein AAF432_10130 [Planctomycetota bacterium]
MNSRDRWWPPHWLTAIAVLHVINLLTHKIATDTTEEMLWLSNVGLMLAVAGLFIRSSLFIGTSLTMIGVAHAIWMFDAACGYTVGLHPLGSTTYLRTADPWHWLATSHHFVLLPGLIFIIVRQRFFERRSFLAACAVFALISVSSRLLLPASVNVNYSHKIFPDVTLATLAEINALPVPLFLLFLNAWVIATLFLPTTIIVRGRVPVISESVAG